MAKQPAGKVIQMLSPENYIRKKARTLPIVECTVSSDWEESGLAQISIARKHTNGNFTFCMYLADLMCLGIKDTHYMFNVSPVEYYEQLEQIRERMPIHAAEYTLIHNIIYAGIEFAEEYGFKPHKDFTSVTQFMLEEDTDDIEMMEIECGKDGNPVYFRGPYEDDGKVQKIIAQLEKTAGPGNYSIIDEDEEVDDYEEEEVDLDYSEFEGMSFAEKKEQFINLVKRLDKLSEDEAIHFTLLTNLLIDDLIDVEIHNKLFDQYFEDLNVKINDKVPDELLGISPGSRNVPDKLRNQFINIYELINDELKIAKKEFREFEKEAATLPAVCFLELQILQAEDSRKYGNKLKECAVIYPDYQVIKVLWAIEQLSKKNPTKQLNPTPLKLNMLFQNRASIHSIERYYGLIWYLFVIGLSRDLNQIEAFASVVGDLDLSESDESGIGTLVSIMKIHLLTEILLKS